MLFPLWTAVTAIVRESREKAGLGMEQNSVPGPGGLFMWAASPVHLDGLPRSPGEPCSKSVFRDHQPGMEKRWLSTSQERAPARH